VFFVVFEFGSYISFPAEFIFGETLGFSFAPEEVRQTLVSNEPLEVRAAIARPHLDWANLPWFPEIG